MLQRRMKNVSEMEALKEQAKKDRHKKAVAHAAKLSEKYPDELQFNLQKQRTGEDEHIMHKMNTIRNALGEYHSFIRLIREKQQHLYFGLDNTIPGTHEVKVIDLEIQSNGHVNNLFTKPVKAKDVIKKMLDANNYHNDFIENKVKVDSKPVKQCNDVKPKPPKLEMQAAAEEKLKKPNKIESILKEMTQTLPPAITDIETPGKGPGNMFQFPQSVQPLVDDTDAKPTVNGGVGAHADKKSRRPPCNVLASKRDVKKDAPDKKCSPSLKSNTNNLPNHNRKISSSSSSSDDSCSESSSSSDSESEKTEKQEPFSEKKPVTAINSPLNQSNSSPLNMHKTKSPFNNNYILSKENNMNGGTCKSIEYGKDINLNGFTYGGGHMGLNSAQDEIDVGHHTSLFPSAMDIEKTISPLDPEPYLFSDDYIELPDANGNNFLEFDNLLIPPNKNDNDFEKGEKVTDGNSSIHANLDDFTEDDSFRSNHLILNKLPRHVSYQKDSKENVKKPTIDLDERNKSMFKSNETKDKSKSKSRLDNGPSVKVTSGSKGDKWSFRTKAELKSMPSQRRKSTLEFDNTNIEENKVRKKESNRKNLSEKGSKKERNMKKERLKSKVSSNKHDVMNLEESNVKTCSISSSAVTKTYTTSKSTCSPSHSKISSISDETSLPTRTKAFVSKETCSSAVIKTSVAEEVSFALSKTCSTLPKNSFPSKTSNSYAQADSFSLVTKDSVMTKVSCRPSVTDKKDICRNSPTKDPFTDMQIKSSESIPIAKEESSSIIESISTSIGQTISPLRSSPPGYSHGIDLLEGKTFEEFINRNKPEEPLEDNGTFASLECPSPIKFESSDFMDVEFTSPKDNLIELPASYEQARSTLNTEVSFIRDNYETFDQKPLSLLEEFNNEPVPLENSLENSNPELIINDNSYSTLSMMDEIKTEELPKSEDKSFNCCHSIDNDDDDDTNLERTKLTIKIPLHSIKLKSIIKQQNRTNGNDISRSRNNCVENSLSSGHDDDQEFDVVVNSPVRRKRKIPKSKAVSSDTDDFSIKDTSRIDSEFETPNKEEYDKLIIRISLSKLKRTPFKDGISSDQAAKDPPSPREKGAKISKLNDETSSPPPPLLVPVNIKELMDRDEGRRKSPLRPPVENSITCTSPKVEPDAMEIVASPPCEKETKKKRGRPPKERSNNIKIEMDESCEVIDENVCHECGTLRKDYGRDPRKTSSYKSGYSAYYNEGRRKKHEADNLKVAMAKAHKYIEAVLKYVQYLIGLELSGRMSEIQGIDEYMQLASECIQLVDYVITKYGRKETSSNPTYDVRFTLLCLRLQSILYLKLFKVKKDSAVRYSRVLSRYFKQYKASSHIGPTPFNRPHNRGSTGTPSPSSHSPGPSPSGSIASIGSAGSSGSAGSNDIMVNGIGPFVSIPSDIHEKALQYLQYSKNLLHGHLLWEDSDMLIPHCQAFLVKLSRKAGQLTMQSSMLHVVDYITAGLELTKELPKS